MQKPTIDSVQMKDYQLVRVGLDVAEGRWFSHTFTTSETTATERSLPDPNSLRAHLREFREKCLRIRFEKQQKRKLQDVREQVYSEIKHFLTELASFIDNRYECRCVYADTVRKSLILQEDCWLPRLWKQCWQFPEFKDFLQPQWVEPLLENTRLHHFVVMGLADSMPYVILHCASRMKSLRILLRESEDDQRLRDFVEDIYTEYGLAAAIQTLEGERVFSRLLLETREPVCVLDFTGETCIPTSGLAHGSVWIDFCSVEEKARRVMERGEGIFYFSMKEFWKQAGKP